MTVNDTLITGMMVALGAAFTIPIIIIMYLMVKVKVKGLLAFAMSGALATLAGPVAIGTVIRTVLVAVGIDNSILNASINGITLVVGIAVFMKFISPGGVNIGQSVALGTGCAILYAVFFVALEIIQNITIISYIKQGDLTEYLGDDYESQLKVWEDLIKNLSATEYFVSGYLQILFIIFAIAVALFILKGIVDGRFIPCTIIMSAIYAVKEVGYAIFADRVNSIAGAVYVTVFAVFAILYIIYVKKHNIVLLSQVEMAKQKKNKEITI